MPITAEILNTTFSDLRGPMERSFVVQNTLWDALYQKSRTPQNSGSLIERTFAGGAPARGVGIYAGDELLNMTRRQQTRRFIVEPHRTVVAVNIPKKELNYNTGKLAVMRLIEEYPETVMLGVARDINSYMLTGVSAGIVFQTAELRGYLSLNGQVTTGRGTGVSDGLLDFTDPALQADTVQSVAKSQALFNFNQYNDIGAWNAEGLFQLYRTYRQCAHYAQKGRGPDVMIMDDETFANFEQSRRANVRVEVVEDKTEKTNLLSLDFGIGMVYHDLDLDRTLFTGDAADGVTYMLNTDFIEMPMSEEPNIGEFKERLGDQDVITAHMACQHNLIFRKFTPHGCVSGGAI